MSKVEESENVTPAVPNAWTRKSEKIFDRHKEPFQQPQQRRKAETTSRAPLNNTLNNQPWATPERKNPPPQMEGREAPEQVGERQKSQDFRKQGNNSRRSKRRRDRNRRGQRRGRQGPTPPGFERKNDPASFKRRRPKRSGKVRNKSKSSDSKKAGDDEKLSIVHKKDPAKPKLMTTQQTWQQPASVAATQPSTQSQWNGYRSQASTVPPVSSNHFPVQVSDFPYVSQAPLAVPADFPQSNVATTTPQPIASNAVTTSANEEATDANSTQRLIMGPGGFLPVSELMSQNLMISDRKIQKNTEAAMPNLLAQPAPKRSKGRISPSSSTIAMKDASPTPDFVPARTAAIPMHHANVPTQIHAPQPTPTPIQQHIFAHQQNALLAQQQQQLLQVQAHHQLQQHAQALQQARFQNQKQQVQQRFANRPQPSANYQTFTAQPQIHFQPQQTAPMTYQPQPQTVTAIGIPAQHIHYQQDPGYSSQDYEANLVQQQSTDPHLYFTQQQLEQSQQQLKSQRQQIFQNNPQQSYQTVQHTHLAEQPPVQSTNRGQVEQSIPQAQPAFFDCNGWPLMPVGPSLEDLCFYQQLYDYQQQLSLQSQEFQPEHLKWSSNNHPMGEHASQTMYFDSLNQRDQYGNSQSYGSFSSSQQQGMESKAKTQAHENRQSSSQFEKSQHDTSKQEFDGFESKLSHVAQPFESSLTSESDQSQIPRLSWSPWDYATYPPMMFNPMTMPTQEPVEQIPSTTHPVPPGTVYPVQEPRAQQTSLYSEVTQTPSESLSSQSNGLMVKSISQSNQPNSSSVMKSIGRPPNFNASSKEELLHLFTVKIGLNGESARSYADTCFKQGANAEVLANWYYTFWNLKLGHAHSYMMQYGLNGETNERFEALHNLFKNVMKADTQEAFQLTRRNWREDKNIEAGNIEAWFNVFHKTCHLELEEAKRLSLQYKYIRRGQGRFASLFHMFHKEIGLKTEQSIQLCKSCYEREDINAKVVWDSFSFYRNRPGKSKMQALVDMKQALNIGSRKP